MSAMCGDLGGNSVTISAEARGYVEWMRRLGGFEPLITEARMHPVTWEALGRAYFRYGHPDLVRIYGVRVVRDETMEPGLWRAIGSDGSTVVEGRVRLS